MMLSESRTLGEVKKIRDIAQALRMYAKAAHMSRATQNHAAEIKILAERRAGDFLAKMERAKPKPTGGRVRNSEYRMALRDTETTERTAERWQMLATIPEPSVTEYFNAMRNAEDGEITTAGLMAHYKEIVTIERREQRERAHASYSMRKSGTGCGGKIGPFDCCTVICGDAGELLHRVPDGSVGAVVTDPPYGVNANAWDARVPYELLGEFHRVALGPIVWFGAAPKIVEAAREFDPPPDRILIWAPAFTLSHVVSNGMAYRYQPIHAWRLPKQHDGPTWDVLDTNTEMGNWWKHSCTKPLALMKELCELAPDRSIVLDPFAGIGTTLVAARASGRHFLGFEVNLANVAICEARLRDQTGNDG